MSKVIEHPALKAVQVQFFWIGAVFALCCGGCPSYIIGNERGKRICTEEVCTDICQQMHGDQAVGHVFLIVAAPGCECLLPTDPISTFMIAE